MATAKEKDKKKDTTLLHDHKNSCSCGGSALNTPSFIDLVKSNIAVNQYQQIEYGQLKIKRSVIPKEVCTHQRFHLDEDSNLEFSTIALGFRVTPDELVRQLVWSFNQSFRENKTV